MKKFALRDKKSLLITASILLLALLVPHGPVAAIGEGIAEDVLTWVMTILLQIVGAITYLGGSILNFVVKISIVDMKEYVDAAGIDNAWKVIRDVSNMGFIFILLYAAIMTILGKGSDNKRLIVNVVLAAVLINFSLFFTKLFIDATNLVALLFYGQMVPASELVQGGAFQNQGLASTIMESIKIQSIWTGGAGDGVSTTQILIVGLLGSVVALISAFVFFAIAILFIIRFVALLITMVLSPLAFLAFALPQAEKYRKQWWDALSGQALFAPIYFLLTWVVISIAQSLSLSDTIQGTGDWASLVVTKAVGGPEGQTLVTESNPQSIGIVVNFGIIIALLIASLTIAKEWANKAGGTATKLTKWATGMAGKTTFGVAGFAGRRTIGAAGAALGDSDTLKKAVSRGGATGMAARLTLAAGRKTAKQSFDIRGTGLGSELDAGKATGKGGFDKYREEKAKEEAKFATSLAPSPEKIRDAEKDLEKIQKTDETTEEFGNEHKQAVIKQRREAREKAEEVKRREVEYAKYSADVKSGKIKANPSEVARYRNEIDTAKKEQEESERKASEILSRKGYKQSKVSEAQAKVDELKGVDDDRAKEKIKSRMEKEGKSADYAEYIKSDAAKAEIASLKKEGKSAGDRRKDSYADVVENSTWAKIAGYNRAASTAIRKGKKSVKDLVDEALKASGEKKGDEENTEKPDKTTDKKEVPKEEGK